MIAIDEPLTTADEMRLELADLRSDICSLVLACHDVISANKDTLPAAIAELRRMLYSYARLHVSHETVQYALKSGEWQFDAVLFARQAKAAASQLGDA